MNEFKRVSNRKQISSMAKSCRKIEKVLKTLSVDRVGAIKNVVGSIGKKKDTYLLNKSKTTRYYKCGRFPQYNPYKPESKRQIEINEFIQKSFYYRYDMELPMLDSLPKENE